LNPQVDKFEYFGGYEAVGDNILSFLDEIGKLQVRPGVEYTFDWDCRDWNTQMDKIYDKFAKFAKFAKFVTNNENVRQLRTGYKQVKIVTLYQILLCR